MTPNKGAMSMNEGLHRVAAKSKPGKRKSTKKAGGHPWYKRYPEDYRRGTRLLSIAARGAYSDLLDLMFIEDGGLPDNDMWIACALHIKLRQWRALRKELIDAKKIYTGDDGLIHNRRADDEIRSRSVRVECASSARRRNVFAKKFNVTNGGRSTESESESDSDREKRSEESRSPKEEQKKEKARKDFLTPSGTDGGGGERLPFSRSTLADIEKLGVDAVALYERYKAKTKGKRIGDPSAYLLQMAQEKAAKALGCRPQDLKGVVSRNQAVAVSAQCAALGTKPHGPQPLAGILARMNPKKSDGAALMAALKGAR